MPYHLLLRSSSTTLCLLLPSIILISICLLLHPSSCSASDPSFFFPSSSISSSYFSNSYSNNYSNNHSNNNNMPKQQTTRPITTGTSVIGLVYDGGVMLAADTLLSYGSMAKSFTTPRIMKIDDASQILIGASGEYSDLQEIIMKVKALALEESATSSIESIYTSRTLRPKQLWNYLRAVMYQKRSKMTPYWNDLVIGGYDTQTQQLFLGTVDKLGTTLESNLVATGFGSYLAMPLLREKWTPSITEGEARALLEDCMKVLFYRDCRASNRIVIAKCTNDGECLVSEPYNLDTNDAWNAPSMVRPVGDLHAGQDGGW